MKYVLSFAVVCALAAAAGRSGLPARTNANDYPAFTAQNGIQVGAEALSQDQAKKYFATSVYNGYAVVEVAIYPNNHSVNLRNLDFSLRVDGYSSPIRPASPEAVAASLTRPADKQDHTTAPSRFPDVTVYPTATVGVESGGYDPSTGRRGTHAVYGGGVGVAVGGSGQNTPPVPPQARDRNRSTMETELRDKQLPEGTVDAPVAGYLYFPLPSGKKKVTVTALEYTGDNGTVNLVFPKKH